MNIKMNINLYQYGLSNALDNIEKLLVDSLNTTDKKKKAQFVSEAYGMVKAINMLVDVDEEENNEEEKREELDA